ncbi:MAG: hypothetical protein FXF47_07290 [Candidatus Mcinerneyibacterium aminivorans]|uniref:Lipoprotein n=1 Tax=Candidatus Mcinerneyibacterium aminivorans TaxID=2703815 RepID=A0A5D0MAM7_9BACT|nr:MAG: hypothetical protein FXF47_07290 [Candidatus Mcinerneyibacterium aminivorans]
MRKITKWFLVGIVLIFVLGCSSGGNPILDKAAITKAKTKINDLAKIVGSYKRLRGELPPEDKPLFDSLSGFMTEKKKAEFKPTVQNIYNQYLESKITDEVEELSNETKQDIMKKVEEDEEIVQKYFEQLKEKNEELYEGELSEDLLKDLKVQARQQAIEQLKRQEAKKNLTEKEKNELMKKAKDLYRRQLPPFNTDPEDGGWENPKWVILKPKKEVVLQDKIENFKEQYGRAPSNYRIQRLEDQTEAYVKSKSTGYVIWMANDSNNTLVYAKVQ